MREAGNTIEMDEYPGMYHAFDMIDPDHGLSRIAIEQPANVGYYKDYTLIRKT